MHSGQRVVWTSAIAAAERHCHPDAWRAQLAQVLCEAVEPDIAAVFTCPLGNPFLGRHATRPESKAAVAESVIARLAALYQTGGQHFYLEKREPIFATTADLDGNPATRALHQELLAPAGLTGTVVAFFRSRDNLLAGWIQLFTSAEPIARCAFLKPDLERVRAAAENTLRVSLEVASEIGASVPARSLELLTWREREVALLVGAGLTDLNIASRLKISEGTVGRHLQSIFRKLGVHARLELVVLVAKAAP